MPRLIALVGLPGAGKSVVCDRFVEFGFERIYFGGLIQEEVQRRGLAINEQNERLVREDLRAQGGMAAIAKLALPKIKSSITHDIIIDGLYSWEEYLLLKTEFPQLIVVAVYAPPKMRYDRLMTRSIRPLTGEQARSRDYSQIENLDQAGPIAMADYTLNNTGDLEKLLFDTDTIINASN